MKQALVTLDDYARQWKLDYKFIGNIHDGYNRRWLQTKQRSMAGSQWSASRRQAWSSTSDVPLTENTKLEQRGQRPTEVNV